MQRQPTSVFLVADAYRHELLADAERVGRTSANQSDGRGASTLLALGRRTIGLTLSRAGKRLVNGDTAASVGDAAVPSAGRSQVYSN